MKIYTFSLQIKESEGGEGDHVKEGGLGGGGGDLDHLGSM